MTAPSDGRQRALSAGVSDGLSDAASDAVSDASDLHCRWSSTRNQGPGASLGGIQQEGAGLVVPVASK